jgi:hypothetical protein
MTEPDGMYGEDIRRALSAVADFAVPAGDGLAKIRQRTKQRPPAFAWLFAYATYLPRLATVSFRVPASELVLIAKGQSTLHKRMWAGLRVQVKRLGQASPNSWMRPALAAAGALAVVVAVMLAIPGLRQTVSPSSLNSNNPGGGGGGNSSAGFSQSTSASSTGPVIKPSTKGPQSIITMPPRTSPATECASRSGSGGGSSYIPPEGNPTPTATGGMGDVTGAKLLTPQISDTTLGNDSISLTAYSMECSPTSPPSSPPPTSPPSSPPPSSPPPSPSSSPPTPSISPSGGGTPTPTGTAISDSPSPSPSPTDSDSSSTGGS